MVLASFAGLNVRTQTAHADGGSNDSAFLGSLDFDYVNGGASGGPRSEIDPYDTNENDTYIQPAAMNMWAGYAWQGVPEYAALTVPVSMLYNSATGQTGEEAGEDGISYANWNNTLGVFTDDSTDETHGALVYGSGYGNNNFDFGFLPDTAGVDSAGMELTVAVTYFDAQDNPNNGTVSLDYKKPGYDWPWLWPQADQDAAKFQLVHDGHWKTQTFTIDAIPDGSRWFGLAGDLAYLPVSSITVTASSDPGTTDPGIPPEDVVQYVNQTTHPFDRANGNMSEVYPDDSMFSWVGGWWRDGWYWFYDNGGNAGDTFTMKFYGTSVSGYGPTNVTGYDVYIDDGAAPAFTHTYNGEQWIDGTGAMFTIDGLTAGEHVMEVVNKGDGSTLAFDSFSYVNGSAPVDPSGPAPANRTDVQSPALRSSLTDDNVTVAFTNATGATAKVWSQKQPSDTSQINTNGTKDLVADVTLADGAGSFVFPASQFPKGPIAIRIDVYDAQDRFVDTAYAQYYNTVGVEWKTGLGEAPVNPVTQGMNVTYADDFKTMPGLSVAGEGMGSSADNTAIAADAAHSYATRKVDEARGGMFGWSYFADHDGSKYDPFSLTDHQYMKLATAYWPEGNVPGAADYWGQKTTTGYLSSLGQDGSGFHTTGGHNQYFEARMFVGPNPAHWPAFWLLTSNGAVDSDGSLSPVFGGPSDELDVNESYLGTPDGYQTTSHQWGYDTGKGGGQWNDIDAPDWSNINIAMGFHIFGVLITEQTTTYYVDNIPVFNRPTTEVSWEKGSYFILNGGVSDHYGIPQDGADTFGPDDQPMGFTRYGNSADDYIDWVRVYEDADNTPRFETPVASVSASPGDYVTADINRNAAAQAVGGMYNVTFPNEGWQVLDPDTNEMAAATGTTANIPFQAGSAQDQLMFLAPDSIPADSQVVIGVTYGEDHTVYQPDMTVKLITEGDQGTMVDVNRATYPYRAIGGGTQGGWSNYDASANEQNYFTFVQGNWWNDGWSWMYDNATNAGTVQFSFHGNAFELDVTNGDSGWPITVSVDGEDAQTYDTYAAADAVAVAYTWSDPSGQDEDHVVTVQEAEGAPDGRYTRLNDFKYWYHEDHSIPSYTLENHHYQVSQDGPIKPGDVIHILIDRNAASGSTYGSYDITLPSYPDMGENGYQIISNSSQVMRPVDDVQIQVPSDPSWQGVTDTITIVPPQGSGVTTPLAVSVKAPDPAAAPAITGDHIIQVNSSTYPYANILPEGGGGAWANGWNGSAFDASTQDIQYFAFNGGWWSDSYGWMYTSASDGQYVDFDFTGDAAALYVEYHSDGAPFDVYLDGALQGSYSSKGNTPSLRVFSVSGLTAGEHTLRVETTGSGTMKITGFDYDAADSSPPQDTLVKINQDTHPLPNGQLQASDSDDSVFGWSGGWWRDGWNWFYDNGGNANDFFTISFSGTSISGYGPMGGNTHFDVYVDDVNMGSYDNGAADNGSGMNELFHIEGLTAGDHALKVVNTGGGDWLAFNEFDYLEVPVTDPQGTLTKVNADTYPGNGQGPWSSVQTGTYFTNLNGGWWRDGTWMYTAGDSSLDFNFTGTEVWVYGSKMNTSGTIRFSVDGAPVSTVDANDPDASWPGAQHILLFHQDGLQAGPHRVTVNYTALDQAELPAGENRSLLILDEFAYMYVPVAAQFAAPASVDGTQGQELVIPITRNDAAGALSGFYKVTLPDGFIPIANVDFAAGSSEDDITVTVPADYSTNRGVITVTPVSGGLNYPVMTIAVNVPLLPPTDIVSLTDPSLYRSTISGDTTLQFVALGGYTSAKAQFLHAPDAAHTDSHGYIVETGAVGMDENGIGSVTVDADQMPHGPVSVRVVASTTAGDTADGYFNFWNDGGQDWNVGLPADSDLPAVAQGKGLGTVFSDDFDSMPSISYTGSGATYAAHKPDYQDYGEALFADPDSAYDPFSQVESYLRITTTKYDQKLPKSVDGYERNFSTGFLSSAHDDGSGFWTDGNRDQYFEVRMFFPANPSQWPAFWTLSNLGNRAGHAGTDELDINETWLPSTGYSVNTHQWSYSTGLGGTIGAVDTEAVTGAGVGNVMMGFHTYGVYITKDITYYFFDGVQVGQEKTLPLSYRDGNFFMINNAITGSGDYPEGYGFERYGNQSEMYVDYVRVMEGPVHTDPLFNLDYDNLGTVSVAPGQDVSIKIDRVNSAAANMAGQYQVDMPEGWTVVSGGTFAAGAAIDTLVLHVPDNYVRTSDNIGIQPADTAGNPVPDQEPLVVPVKNTDDSFGVSVYPAYNADTTGWDAAVSFTSKKADATFAPGQVTVKDSGGHVVGTASFGELLPGATRKVVIPDLPIDMMTLTNLTFEITREDGYVKDVDRPMSGLTVPKTDNAIDVSGPFDASQWDSASTVHLGEAQYTDAGAAYPGEDKFSLNQYVKWDSNFLYIAAAVKDSNHVNTADTGLNAWGSDSIQLSFDPTRAGGFSADKDHIRYTGGLLPTGADLGNETGVMNPDIQYHFYRDAAARTTYYLMAFPWSSFGIANPSADGTDLGFTLLVNNNDGFGRTGWLSYMDGIATGKNPYQFGDLILSGLTELPTTPTETVDKSALQASIDHAGTLNQADYAADSWSDLQNALTAASSVAADANSGQAEVDAALAALQNAIENLEEAPPAPVLYAITFDSNGGTVVAAQTVQAGSQAAKPADPAKSGFLFTGWYTDAALANEWDFTSAVTGDLVLYAGWHGPALAIGNGIYDYASVDGVAAMELSKNQLQAILDSATGNMIAMNFTDDSSVVSAIITLVDVKSLKGVGKTITIIINNVSYSVTTQQLFNNSGKPRVITIKNGKLSFKNG